MLVITRGWPRLAALLERSEASKYLWQIVARKRQQMQSSKKPGRWLKTFRTKKCGPEGSEVAHLKPSCYSATASLLGIFFYRWLWWLFYAISGGHLHQNHAEDQGEGWGQNQHGDELVVFFCDTLVDTCWHQRILAIGWRDPVAVCRSGAIQPRCFFEPPNKGSPCKLAEVEL